MKTLIHSLLIFIFIATPAAQAGSQQEPEAKYQPEKIVKFAKNVEKFAAKYQARAFIIARAGRPASELPKGISFTHTAIAIYSEITLNTDDKAKGYAIYNLYQQADKPNKSSLVTDYPVDFFWGAQQLSAGIIIPTPALQERIIEIIASGKNEVLHNPKYSVIANPFNRQYQNCTEHTLDIVNAAIYNTTNIEQLKVNAAAHFKPQRIKTNPIKLALGSMFVDEVTTRDHKGKIYTATFSTIANYLASNQLVQHAGVFQDDGSFIEL